MSSVRFKASESVSAPSAALDEMHQAMLLAVNAGHWQEVERIDRARVKLIHEWLATPSLDSASVGDAVRQAQVINESILKQAAAARIAAAGKLKTMARRQTAVKTYQRAS